MIPSAGAAENLIHHAPRRHGNDHHASVASLFPSRSFARPPQHVPYGCDALPINGHPMTSELMTFSSMIRPRIPCMSNSHG